jgi:hypothetical protein
MLRSIVGESEKSGAPVYALVENMTQCQKTLTVGRNLFRSLSNTTLRSMCVDVSSKDELLKPEFVLELTIVANDDLGDFAIVKCAASKHVS